jgi:hypothetical protein
MNVFMILHYDLYSASPLLSICLFNCCFDVLDCDWRRYSLLATVSEVCVEVLLFPHTVRLICLAQSPHVLYQSSSRIYQASTGYSTHWTAASSNQLLITLHVWYM